MNLEEDPDPVLGAQPLPTGGTAAGRLGGRRKTGGAEEVAAYSNEGVPLPRQQLEIIKTHRTLQGFGGGGGEGQQFLIIHRIQ